MPACTSLASTALHHVVHLLLGLSQHLLFSDAKYNQALADKYKKIRQCKGLNHSSFHAALVQGWLPFSVSDQLKIMPQIIINFEGGCSMHPTLKA